MRTICHHVEPIAAGLLLVAGCFHFSATVARAQSPGSHAAETASIPPNNDYVVGSQDVLTITVWDQLDLSGKFNVESDGTFTFPLIGRVKAGGLTLRDVEGELKQRLSRGYFKNPQLSVAVGEYRSQRIFVVGEVRTPGSYSLSGDMTLIEALARAGSTTDRAASAVVIVRPATDRSVSGPQLPGQQEGSEVRRVDINNLQSGALANNVVLRNGDTVFVPRAENIYVFGQVNNPGAFPLAADTTVLQALSLAGGTTDRGTTRRIKVVRLVKGKQQEVNVNLNDLLQPGDTIIVPERFF